MIFTCLKNILIGTQARESNFQSYLIEGIAAWNEDRAHLGNPVSPHTGDHLLRHALNSLSHRVLGQELYPNPTTINEYTGQIINKFLVLSICFYC